MMYFVQFDLEIYFALQWHAIFHFSSGQLAPHPPRDYFSTLRSHKLLEKHSVSRFSYLFAHLYLLSSDSFSSTLLSSNLSLLSASALLCFSSVHILGNLTSKFPLLSRQEIPNNMGGVGRIMQDNVEDDNDNDDNDDDDKEEYNLKNNMIRRRKKIISIN